MAQAQLSQTQIMEFLGYAELQHIRLKNMIEHANDPDMDPTTQAACKADALATLDTLQQLLNTVYQAIGRQQPSTTLAQNQIPASLRP